MMVVRRSGGEVVPGRVSDLPQWLVDSLRLQLGDGFWPLVESLNAPAGLDLRVNTLKDKRADVQKELAKAGAGSEASQGANAEIAALAQKLYHQISKNWLQPASDTTSLSTTA